MISVILNFLVKLLVLFTALPVHEFAHAWAADKLGDPTAKHLGRLTLNPKAHLDPWGAAAMFLIGFGWAKPVPVNPHNFKNPKLGMALTSLAGPVSNLIMAYVAMVIYKILVYTISSTVIADVFFYMVLLNVGLAVFNLVPVPPLDGSRIATLFMNEQAYFNIMRYEKFIFIGLFAVVYMGILDKPLAAAEDVVFNVMNWLTIYIDLIFG